MIKLPEGTEFNVNKLKNKYDIGFLHGSIYKFEKYLPDNGTVWKIDEKEIKLDNYDSIMGFPFYLRQIYVLEANNACK